MKVIDARAPDPARAASNRRRTACRRTRPVKEELAKNPALIAPPCFRVLSKAVFSACEAGAPCDGLFPQAAAAYYWFSFYR